MVTREHGFLPGPTPATLPQLFNTSSLASPESFLYHKKSFGLEVEHYEHVAWGTQESASCFTAEGRRSLQSGDQTTKLQPT